MENSIGIRAHDLSEKQTPLALVALLKQYDFHTIQLVFPKAFLEPVTSLEQAQDIAALLSENEMKVAMLGAYFNPVHSDPKKVLSGIDNFKKNLAFAHAFKNNPYVGSETGSYHDQPWIYDPRNQTEEGYQQTKAVFKELTQEAERLGSRITIESAWNHVIYCYQEQARLLQELNSESVFATVDLFNLLYEGNFDQRNDVFEGALKTLGSKVKIIHIKDGTLENGKLVQKTPGEGQFDYPFMISCVRKYCPEATLVFEGVKAEGILKAKKVLQDAFLKV
jgi:L-ribulose-5-phosphate 3-epimerase